jgi:hypothetical protein
LIWSFSLTRYKIANTAAAMPHLRELPPHELKGRAVKWEFLATAAQCYTWLKKDSSEIQAKVLKVIRRGS